MRRHAPKSAPLLALLLFGTPVTAQEKAGNDGTDPTRLISTASVALEHLDLRGGFWNDTINSDLTLPFSAGDRASLRIRAPLVATNIGTSRAFGLGDIGFRLTRVLGVTKTHGWVGQGELILDTAARPELGTGQNVGKATLIYARFLKGGHIFAPALVHSQSIWGDDARPKVSFTTVDFYYVPRLANPKLYMTLDPSLNYNWQRDVGFGALAVTMGYRLGPALGGAMQVFVKPSAAVGTDRSFNWGLQAGVQLLGF